MNNKVYQITSTETKQFLKIEMLTTIRTKSICTKTIHSMANIFKAKVINRRKIIIHKLSSKRHSVILLLIKMCAKLFILNKETEKFLPTLTAKITFKRWLLA